MRVGQFAAATLGLVFGTMSFQPLVAQKKAIITAPVAAGETVSFDVFIPQQHRKELDALLADLTNPASANYHKWLTPTEVQSRFGTDPAKIAAIQKELSNYGLVATLAYPHVLHVTGSAAEAQKALATPLFHATSANGKAVIVASQAVTPLASMQSVNAMVTGLSGTIRMHHTAVRQTLPDNRYSPYGPYWFDDLKQAYDWPSFKSYNGTGATIAVLVDGGYSQADMDAYFGYEGLPSPKFAEIDVLGGSPYNPNSDGTLEATLDMQQSAGMAPTAFVLLYSMPDLSDQSFVAGLEQIITDNKADVVNMSFGGAELAYTAPYNDGVDYTGILVAEDDLIAEGTAEGITFVASSGDQGALSIPAPACFFTDNNPCGTFRASVNFPASSPHVTAVGGTNLQTTYNGSTLRSAYVSEEAYANPLTADIFYGTKATGGYWGSGGGDSVVFAQPSFQQVVATGNKKVRTVPDLALHMGGCPADSVCSGQESADVLALDGGFYGVIGTSASSPDFAGLTALNVERTGGRLGNENFYIYNLAAAQNAGTVTNVFHRDIPGFNGLYSSGNKDYNRVLGNGTLYGKDFLLAPSVPSAGNPQSPSNP